MTNKEILDNINKRIGAEEVQKNTEAAERLDNILNMVNVLNALTDIKIEQKVPELVHYLNGTSSRLSDDLDTARNKLKALADKYAAAEESNKIQTMNKRTRFWLIAFLVVIVVLALVALVFTVLNLVYGEEYLNGWCGKIANALGTLDFALGALGFVLERIDDMKKKEIRSAAQKGKETGDYGQFVNVAIRGSFNKTVKIDKVEGDYVAGDKHCGN